jgi:hypothetical protein
MSGLVPPQEQWSFIALVMSPDNAIAYLCDADGQVSATNPVAENAEAFTASTTHRWGQRGRRQWQPHVQWR